jgi:UPF0176 protein
MIRVLLYYHFSPLPAADLDRLRDAHLAFCRNLGILGRIYLATEGINGTCAGTPAAMDAYEAWVASWPGFGGIAWKRDDTDAMPFAHLRVRVKPHLVNLGPEGADIDPAREGGGYLEPAAWRGWLEGDRPYVLLDVRNRIEARVGRFEGALEAPYEHFHEFPRWADEMELDPETPVLMYCTGGIRCEKFSALLRRRGIREVYQLHGGIMRYAREEGGAHFEGEVMVFDDRLSVDIGGTPTTHGRCLWCGVATSRARNCANMDCHRLHLVCEACHEARQGCCTEACQSAPRLRVLPPEEGEAGRRVFRARGVEDPTLGRAGRRAGNGCDDLPHRHGGQGSA